MITMNTKKCLAMTLVAWMTMTMAPTAIIAAELTDTVITTQKSSNLTVNGRQATKQEKAVAKQMVKQGAKMAAKGAKMAASAVTNPANIDKLADEMEAMGNEMERLGDSLETLAEDTTFFYEGEDEDSVFLSDSDLDDLGEEIEEDFGWLNSWWGKLFGGSLGILGAIFGILVATLVIVLLLVVFTAPLWVIFLIVWLIVRNNRKPHTTAYVNPPLNTATSQTTGNTATADAATTANPPHTAASASDYVQPYPDENMEMWKSGVMTACIGVGLIIFFIALGLEDLWGIGALVGCIGVAKLVIASTTKKKSTPTEKSMGSYNNNPAPTTDDYNKSENA